MSGWDLLLCFERLAQPGAIRWGRAGLAGDAADQDEHEDDHDDGDHQADPEPALKMPPTAAHPAAVTASMSSNVSSTDR